MEIIGRRSGGAASLRGGEEGGMADDLEDSAQWRGRMEERLGTLETKVGAEAHLRAAMDEDMGTLSAKFGVQEKLIQAISVTQSEHTAMLRDHTARLEKLEIGQDEMRTKLDLVHVGVQAIHTLLTGLTANETPEGNQVSANPADADPDALPDSRGGCH
jgi:uncharacterized coiled-coil protein SlyX